MCTFDLSFNNALIDSIRPAFKDENAIKEWMQCQLETLISQFKAVHCEAQAMQNAHSLSHLRGIGTPGPSIEEMREEYLITKKIFRRHRASQCLLHKNSSRGFKSSQ